jgi:hypothetical protein
MGGLCIARERERERERKRERERETARVSRGLASMRNGALKENVDGWRS